MILRTLGLGAVLFASIAAESRAQALFDEVHTVSRVASAAERSFDLANAGDYDVRLTDNAFPAAFASLKLIVTRGTQIAATVNAPGSAVRFTTTAGTHRVHVIGTPTTAAGSGSFGVEVLPVGSTTPAFQFAGAINLPTVPVNPNVSTLQAQFTATASGTYQVKLTDFQFPAALQTLTLNILGPGGTPVFTTPPAAPGTYSFTAAPADYDLFVIAEVTSAAGSGAYSVQVSQGAQVLYSEVQSVNVQSTAVIPGYTFEADVAAAGSYRVTLTDFQFRAAFQSLSLNLTQAGTSLGTLTAPSTTRTIDVPAAGRIFVSAVAQPVSTAVNSLFGLRLEPAAGGSALIDVTQGVGPLFDARAVTATTAGSYDVTLTDVGFPVTFADISLAVTRGVDRIGTIIAGGGGSGTFSFNAMPGVYFLNFVAVSDATANAGTYGLRVSPTPLPTVTLAAASTNVQSGSSATLNWSTTNVTACIASGAWSGNKSTSGSETSVALTNSGTFALTCTGPGGSANQSVTVNVTVPASKGGGGALGWLTIAIFAAVLLARGVSRDDARHSVA